MKTPYNTLRPRTRPYIVPRTKTRPKGFRVIKSARILTRTAQPISHQVRRHRRGGI